MLLKFSTDGEKELHTHKSRWLFTIPPAYYIDKHKTKSIIGNYISYMATESGITHMI